ncbi:hypothetical protein [Cellulosilyticum ruminicola]|uniref:hypothetical protein n=1 Tax=Cellulosilyticum ruminicola TaxID=425254 RepID=UPI000A900238|nr:hypothetical protein [Cellulosilyticum ruminicola]
MPTNNILHKNYILTQEFYHLKLPLDIDSLIPNNDSVHLLSQFVEEIDLSELYSTYSRIRKNSATPRQMLSFKYQNIVADSGYESEENYLFVEGLNLLIIDL